MARLKITGPIKIRSSFKKLSNTIKKQNMLLFDFSIRTKKNLVFIRNFEDV